MALLKLIYLTTQNIAKKWTMPAQNWSLTLSQLSIIFPQRLRLDLQVSPSGLAAFFKPSIPRGVNLTPISPDTVPGTLPHRLEENLKAAQLTLTAEDLEEIKSAFSSIQVQGACYP